MEKLTLKVPVVINAPAEDVWDGLTNPDIVEQYFFGTRVDTDWQKGSPIFFRGEWEGVTYEDKGTILDIVPGQHVTYDYWSSMSKLPDKPEHYQTVSYDIESQGANQTRLTITQAGIDSEAKKDHSEENWKMVLSGLKKVVERK